MTARHALLDQLVEASTGARVVRQWPLADGCVGRVVGLELSDGERLVAKTADGPAGGLKLEGFMLGYLKRHSRLPVPRVLHADDHLLLMEMLHGGGRLDGESQRQAAEIVAHLHGVTGPAYGFERDTVIGGLPQPNPWSDDWVGFFADHRLRHMAEAARREGQLPGHLADRVDKLAATLGRWIDAPAAPALIHGDLWTGNVLVDQGRISGFVDPAIYYADPEIELAFSTLFGTFGQPFFERYQEIRPLSPGFFEARRDLYNLYPLLVHVRLFGGGYVNSVARLLERFGA
ncbi:fructosamine kinase family protein [Roseospirillum parvum]|uniref:Fructosamine-3-kinase n=1 Tax=Roseospirillum parvum TaxID=83401 RepID=A0A1G7ZJZ7_9PROT|nr:fructosamine kinase family protein [Roseospirillum parvum]SDH08886.1 Fructosamine-3-kinase [Roseospirillum parvum]